MSNLKAAMDDGRAAAIIAHDLINGRANSVAALIMSQLAHRCGLTLTDWHPGDPPPQKVKVRL